VVMTLEKDTDALLTFALEREVRGDDRPPPR
jgi:hypothetical protein